jgi:hypothetical protein
MIGCEERVAQHHREASPAAEQHQFVQRFTALNGPRRSHVAQIMPAQGIQPRHLDRGLKRQRVAVINAHAAPAKQLLTVPRQGLQDIECIRRKQQPERLAGLHVARRYLGASAGIGGVS